MDTTIKEEKFSVSQILSVGWQHFMENWKTILIVFLIVYVPINIFLSFFSVDRMVQHHGASGANMYVHLANLMQLLFGVIATLSIANIINASVNGTPITAKEAFGLAFKRWGASVWTSILVGIILFLLFLLLIIPGIIWSVYYTFFLFVVALREGSGMEALGYSKKLVKGQWWRVFGICLVIGVLSLIPFGVLWGIFNFLPHNQIFSIIHGTLSNLSGTPFMAMMIVFFLNTDYIKNTPESEEPAAITTDEQTPEVTTE